LLNTSTSCGPLKFRIMNQEFHGLGGPCLICRGYRPNRRYHVVRSILDWNFLEKFCRKRATLQTGNEHETPFWSADCTQTYKLVGRIRRVIVETTITAPPWLDVLVKPRESSIRSAATESPLALAIAFCSLRAL
jgi:hypothetical protein